MRYLIACIIRAIVEGVVGTIFVIFLLICAALAGLGKLYRWSVKVSQSRETPEQRAEREHEEWKWR